MAWDVEWQVKRFTAVKDHLNRKNAFCVNCHWVCADYAKIVISLPHVFLYVFLDIYGCVCPLARIHTHIKLSVWPCLSTDTEKNHPATSPQYF